MTAFFLYGNTAAVLQYAKTSRRTRRETLCTSTLEAIDFHSRRRRPGYLSGRRRRIKKYIL